MPNIGPAELLIVLVCCGVPIVGTAVAFIAWVLVGSRR